MQEFMTVYETLERWAPGSDKATLQALDMLPFVPKNILEIGCGTGVSTILLAQHSSANVTAVDNQQSALARLDNVIAAQGFQDRVNTLCASMTDLDFEDESFDVIWAEGCAYVMGVENALSEWKRLLKKNGILVFSDLVWLTVKPSPEALDFWKVEYPDMQDVDFRKKQIENAGYQLKGDFTLDGRAWSNYYEPLKSRVMELSSSMTDSQALNDIGNEISVYENYLDEFGYQVFVVEKL